MKKQKQDDIKKKQGAYPKSIALDAEQQASLKRYALWEDFTSDEIRRFEKMKERFKLQAQYDKRKVAIREYPKTLARRKTGIIRCTADECDEPQAMDHGFDENLNCQWCGIHMDAHHREPAWCRKNPDTDPVEYLRGTDLVAHLLPDPHGNLVDKPNP
jgi:hypothetical protein